MKRIVYTKGLLMLGLACTAPLKSNHAAAVLLQAHISIRHSQALSGLKPSISSTQHLINSIMQQQSPQNAGKITSVTPATSKLAKSLRQAKQNLKPVDPADQNVYAKFILAQRMPYDVNLDLSSFIKKLRIDDGIIIENKTADPIDLAVKHESKTEAGSMQEERVYIKPYSLHILEKDSAKILSSITLVNTPEGMFLNPKFTEDECLQINIETSQDRHFVHQYHPFPFTSVKYTDQQVNDASLTAEERAFRNDFNGSINYLDFAAYQEGMSMAAIDKQRQELYTKNNIGRLLNFEPNLLDSTVYRIPLITHKIWVTADDNPKNPAMSYIKWLEESIKHNPTMAGWTHYFWVERKTKLPELTKLLENHPNIILMELDSLNTQSFLTGNLYKESIKQKKFGKATDIIRLELLRSFGGFYLDTDYELYQSLIPFCKSYDLVVGLEPMSVYLCNAFIGACPNHPVIVKCLEMINRNFSETAPDYIKNLPNNAFKTIVETGPIALTLAFGLAAGQGDYRDIAFPPHIVYPAMTEDYPKKQVITPDSKKPAKAIGGHYWRTAWMDPAFGSNG